MPTEAAPLEMREIRQAFSAPIGPIPVSLGYRLRLFGVLVGLALLQFCYLALIAAVLYFTFLYTAAIWFSGISLNYVTILLYLGPPLAGSIATLFLLKPLVVRPPKPAEPLRLMPEEEPVLFAFVEQLCRTMGSPRPSRIYADLQVNASAAVRGWRGFFLGELNLTIGLPLAVGFPLRHFAGVLAHEFGHFAQRTGLRSHYLIQSIQHWFARVVYQRDHWDHWLDERCGSGDWRVRSVAHMARWVVRGSRWYLTILMKGGTFLSSAFSRQMEYDADRYEAAIAGAEAFEQTSLRLPLLAHGWRGASQDTAMEWSVGRLPDDLPMLTVARTELLAGETAAAILEHVLEQKTGRRDSHPSTADRIASVRRNSTAGVLRLDGPAQLLFRDLAGLCRKVTQHHYESVLEVPAGAAKLSPAMETVRRAQETRNFEESVEEMFGTPSAFCAQWFKLPSDGQGGIASGLDIESFEEAVQTAMLHFAARVISDAGVKVRPESFRLPSSSPEALRTAQAVSNRRLDDLVKRFRESTGSIARRLETGAGSQGYVAAWQSYAALSGCQEQLREMRRCLFARGIVQQNAKLFPAAVCANLLDALLAQSRQRMKEIVSGVGDVPAAVIFDPEAAPTLGAQLCGAAQAADAPLDRFLARCDVTAARALSQLCWFAKNAARPV